MSTPTIPLLPTFRRQQLVLDFSSLRDECPDGIYLSLVPGKPSLWGGVFFVRNGPYTEAILRFQISFPDTYPSSPPLVTFSTDVFHPLVVPLTTYTFSANLDTSSTVSASDEHRLPPGAFSLRYGFPEWFAQRGTLDTTPTTRRRESGPSPDEVKKEETEGAQEEPAQQSTTTSLSNPSSPRPIPAEPAPAPATTAVPAQTDRKTTLLNLLHHIHSSFTDPSILDTLPLSSAGNPSAWHAWRAHRRITSPTTTTGAGVDTSTALGSAPVTGSSSSTSPSSPKHPSAWKWDGVWESRVENAIRESIAEGTLFGSLSSAATAAPASLGLGSVFGGGKIDTSGSKFGSPALGGGGGGSRGMGSAAASAGGSSFDDRQRSQALADRQIRFAKLPDDGMLDVRRRVGLGPSVAGVGR